jgi:hypothetical protein
MEAILKKLPNWLILAAACYVVLLVSYAVLDNRAVELWPPKIHAKDGSLGLASSEHTGRPWVSIETVTPKFSITDCPTRLPASLTMAHATNVHPAQWGGEEGMLWFGTLQGNTVWLSCQPGPVIMIGAAGPEPSSTKSAVDSLVSMISK